MSAREHAPIHPAWGFALVLSIAAIFVLLFTRDDPNATQQVVAAPNEPIEVTRMVVVTATATPTIAPSPRPTLLVVTATFTPPPVIPICSYANDGEYCLRYPGTATLTPLPPLCASITQTPFSPQVCRKGDGQTSARRETE